MWLRINSRPGSLTPRSKCRPEEPTFRDRCHHGDSGEMVGHMAATATRLAELPPVHRQRGLTLGFTTPTYAYLSLGRFAAINSVSCPSVAEPSALLTSK